MQCQQETERGREVENQTVVETARKRTSANALQQGALPWQLSGTGNCQRDKGERKCLHKGPHTGRRTVGDLCCGLSSLFWGTSVC